MLHVAGKKDALVKFEWQQKMIDAVLSINRCDRDGKRDGEVMTRYESKVDTPVVTYLYDGGHGYPRGAQEIVEFFKSQPRQQRRRSRRRQRRSKRNRDAQLPLDLAQHRAPARATAGNSGASTAARSTGCTGCRAG